MISFSRVVNVTKITTSLFVYKKKKRKNLQSNFINVSKSVPRCLQSTDDDLSSSCDLLPFCN